jgi:hypothetical protein
MSYLIIGYSGVTPYRKWITSLLLLPFAFYFILNWGRYTLIDNTNLIIHEAGHFFFSFLGNFIQAAGGTLMQIFFPLFIAFYFFRSGYRTGVQIFIFWLGQNLINISVYAADAQLRNLPLLGKGKHDWYYMLKELALLEQTEIFGYLFFLAGILTIILSLILPLFLDEQYPLPSRVS